MLEDKKEILVIVVTFNGEGDIGACLTPFKNKRENIHCIVIDNGSTDNTVALVKSKFPFVEIIENKNNLGFGAANNIGIRYALANKFDFVYLLNQDAWIEPEDISMLAGIAENNPEYGIISPLQVYAGGNKIDKNFSSHVSKEMKDDFLLPGNEPKQLYRIKKQSLQAAHWLARCDALKKVGGFSPSFFHYGEDNNLCRRMEYYGYHLGIAPGILGVHNRENRVNSFEFNFRLQTNWWTQLASDPNLNGRQMLKLLLPKMFETFLNYPKRFFPALFKFLGIYHKVRENRRVSITQAAPFL